MTEKGIDRSATSLLVLILPIAFLIVLLFQAWPVLLALFVISVSLRIWEQYRWRQWSKQVTPYFNQLIKENQGCLTALDLSMKANLTGSAAKSFLDKKAEEFGAQRKVYEDKGTVYYFLTASALGSIFDDSKPLSEPDYESFTSPAPQLIEPQIETEPNLSQSESSISPIPELVKPSVEEKPSPSLSVFPTATIGTEAEPLAKQQPQHIDVEANVEPLTQHKQEHVEFLEKEDTWDESPKNEEIVPQSLIQSELAKRLDVHSSTVGKRKSDPDFAEWSQGRDPEGIAWEYSPETKEFSPVQTKPKS
ncbi:MAG: hypothetical protein LDL41_22240 [Coleofasciculus sp. S288]|nr:hypothetical protein [Coleofasciculus sp. S288]